MELKKWQKTHKMFASNQRWILVRTCHLPGLAVTGEGVVLCRTAAAHSSQLHAGMQRCSPACQYRQVQGRDSTRGRSWYPKSFNKAVSHQGKLMAKCIRPKYSSISMGRASDQLYPGLWWTCTSWGRHCCSQLLSLFSGQTQGKFTYCGVQKQQFSKFFLCTNPITFSRQASPRLWLVEYF